MSRKYEKVNRIKKYYDNTVDDYFRLLIIDNFQGKPEDLDDKLLEDMRARLYNMYINAKINLNLHDLAYVYCTNTEEDDRYIAELTYTVDM